MADSPRPALDLTTEPAERKIIAIDKIPYEVRQARDLSLADFKYLERVSIRTGHLLTREALTPDESKELAGHLRGVARLAVDAPADVLDKLTDVQRVLVFKVFTELLTPGALLAARAISTPTAFPGRKQSRASSGSTRGRRTKGGSRGRRSGSSKPH